MAGRLLVAATLLAGISAAGSAPGAGRETPAPGVDVTVPANLRSTLGNGLKLILVPRHAVPLIACNLVLRAGARADPAGREGTAALLADLLTYGAGPRDAYAFADAVEGAGGSLDATARDEAIEVHGQFLARDAGLMLQLLADAVLRPHFQSADFDTLRARHIEELKAAKDSNPQALIGIYGRAQVFAGHPYGRAVGGSEQSLARIGLADILEYYAREIGADRATLVIVGDFEPQALRAAIAAAFASWHPAAQPLLPLPEPRRVRGRRVLLVDAPGSTQAYFWLGNVGVSRHFAARAPLQICNSALGGRFGSLLNQALRVQAGLTYDARSEFVRGTVPGEFAISSFTQTESTERAIDLALETLARLHSQGLDARMLDSARAYLLGQFPLGLETNADWAGALGDLDLYDLPESYLGHYGTALTHTAASDLNAVIAAAFPQPDNLVLVLIGDATRLRTVAAKYGALEQMPLAYPDFTPGESRH